MENIEFIAAKDLPVSEAEEVDVLCVVDGELKRKPAEGLGGRAYVIDLTESTELDTTTTQSVITSVSYDTFAQKWWDGFPITVKCLFNGGMRATMHPFGIVYMEGTGIMMAVPSMTGGTASTILFANGTWTPPTE